MGTQTDILMRYIGNDKLMEEGKNVDKISDILKKQ